MSIKQKANSRPIRTIMQQNYKDYMADNMLVSIPLLVLLYLDNNNLTESTTPLTPGATGCASLLFTEFLYELFSK